METQWANKPMDLHPADATSGIRVFECPRCGNRLKEKALDAVGGLCPNDGCSMRPVGTYERHHSLVGKAR